MPSADARLLEQIRSGDAEAGHRFIRDYYPGVYRYLLYLTGRPEMAEDLTQETFLQAWRRLETFEGRSALKPWLYRIAHREFLQALRSQQLPVSLEEIDEPSAPHSGEWVEAVELREVIRKLPREEGEVVLLHYLEGYSSGEISRIVGVPAGTVRYRLSLARAHLQRELGEGDLVYLNQAPEALLRRWAWLPLETLIALEARLSLVAGGWSMVDGPAKAKTGLPPSPPEPSTINRQPSTKGERTMSDNNHSGMSRRKLLEAAGTVAAAATAAGLAGPAAIATPQNEAEITDERLTRKVTVGVKATALSDLCEQLRTDTGIQIVAGPSVADEKVTLFCEKLPLREAMRQLSRPFGYTWLRSGIPGKYRYELVQDLRSQLLEEELHNRDRSAALLALEQEIERYRPFLDLSPDEALARAKTAPPEEKMLLERFADLGWGPIQMYFRLSPHDLAAIRAGQWLIFSAEPRPGEQPLPPEIARGVLQSLREERIIRREDGFGVTTDLTDPRGVSLTAVPEMRAQVKLSVQQTELGQYTLEGLSGRFVHDTRQLGGFSSHGPLAAGKSHAVMPLENAKINARLAREPALRPAATVQPQPDLTPQPPSLAGKGESPGLGSDPHGDGDRPPSPSRGGAGGGVGPEPKVTSADVLEALHRATGMPIISDDYTRLYPLETVSVRDEPRFDALNRLSDTMRLRWNKEDAWLQFRSASFYDDRLKEVPNRLLARWVTSRRQHGVLTLDDIVEIAQLPDAQLDGADMAEGARECFGLAEWDLARYREQRPHLRYLASFTPAQRQEMMSATGLPFTKMSLSQQQQFIALGVSSEDAPLQSLEELAGATLRVDYSVPGWFQWGDPDQMNPTRWVVPLKPIPTGQRVLRPPVRERTREAALAAVRRLDPKLLEALAREWQRQDPRAAATPPADAAQIFPTKLSLTIIYIPGSSNARSPYVWVRGSNITFY
jgi:RNA polymerase sigma-70 factor, ECF subfamily